ncbi:auxin-responsive protein SAUR36-like [Lotus japonicus]|uniref:auxin-responsive protein SAUR36-like n=1 Tax=Lotus japonicus TaxID=34305 RepID=UPI002582BE69|nr:auxin-responsive protein SAUR36-like [Lotus japonicus]
MRFKLGKRVTRHKMDLQEVQYPTRITPIESNPGENRQRKHHGEASHVGSEADQRSKVTLREKRVRLHSGRIRPGSGKDLAVYVGQKDGEFHRVLVSVVYCNHPLFGDLLREAEREYGFHHPGGITIPCRVTEFERVKTRIESGSGVRGGLVRRRCC